MQLVGNMKIGVKREAINYNIIIIFVLDICMLLYIEGFIRFLSSTA